MIKLNKKGLSLVGGFTLIELLVVIAIIGLLSTLAVVSLNNARSKARDARRTSDLRTMQSAIELYKADTNDVIFGTPAAGAGAWAGLGIGVLATYLPGGMPADPDSTASTLYTLCTNDNGASPYGNYLLSAVLENTAPASGSTGALTLWVAGDCINDANAAALPGACNATTGFCLGDISR